MSFEKIRLIDVCDFQGGTQPPKNEWSTQSMEGYIRMLQIRDFTQSQEKHIEYVKCTKKLKTCDADDVLIARYGASIGKILTGLSGAYNVAIVKTVPSEKLHKRYLYHYLCSSEFQNFIKSAGSRAAQAGFNKKELADLYITTPPLAIQEKIATILDQADCLRQKDQKLLKNYDELLESVFYEIFGNPVKNEKGWEKVKLGSICDVGSSKRVFVEELVEDGIPFFRGTEIGSLSVGENITPSLFITQEHYERLKKDTGIPKVGDLLLPSICPDGRIYEVSHDNPFYFKDGRVLWIKVNRDVVNGAFLKTCLKQIFATDYLKIASGTTFAELKIFELKKMETILPPISLQNKFASVIKNIEEQKQLAKKQIQKSEKLFQSLLQKAFKGELLEELEEALCK